MKYTESLKKTKEFQEVYRRGASAAERPFVMYVRKSGKDGNRLGISVSKKVGNSVVRHRIKRLVKESYRLQETSFLQGYDIVVVARQAAAECAQQEVMAVLMRLGDRLHVRSADE